MPAARLFAALSSASLALFVAAFRPCGLALSPESWCPPGFCSSAVDVLLVLA